MNKDGKVSDLMWDLVQQDGEGGDGAHRRTDQERRSDGQAVSEVMCEVSCKVQCPHKLLHNQEGYDPTENPQTHGHRVTVGSPCAGRGQETQEQDEERGRTDQQGCSDSLRTGMRDLFCIIVIKL
ncbi:hypothetical protein F7725_025402 [Dissostichus mawsoni]|uniref:Uncharacterized protein n=1 Tax=Dissostichus mawsoni TaxID=36200 RepID=A0A7J5XD14_DISMA|nr:hypothetical protein F7725_025402 [Dissostichus mawsoni]